MHHVYLIASFLSLGASVALFADALPWALLFTSVLFFLAGMVFLGSKEAKVKEAKERT